MQRVIDLILKEIWLSLNNIYILMVLITFTKKEGGVLSM